MTNKMLAAILAATLVCGTLDIISAFVFAGLVGAAPAQVLRYVASGPFGDGMRDAGNAAAGIGLVTHFAIMAVMVSVFVIAASRIAAIRSNPVLAGVVYGLLLYAVMYWIVVPTRWTGHYPAMTLWSVANALFSHIVCVGIPMALITTRYLGRPAPISATPSISGR
ncbi:MAG: hypothetical protein V4564_04455 [Pseudomonadota bacterium]|uniref:hypothetical protein n=1 Tax=Sphingomonas sp. ERG5 TaxID=1381597 RepID=UPI001F38BE49|nr:hypothetical protein [Sphingomonas sp. ERG5]